MSLASVISFFSREVRSSGRAFMHRPTAAARKTTDSTAVLLEKAAVMLLGTMFSTTFRGLEPVEPAAPDRPSTWALNRPRL